MSEQRGDRTAEAVAHDADAPRGGADPHRAMPAEAAGRPGHDPSDDAAHHRATVDDHDDHGHAGEALGPIDVSAWAAGIAGVALGLVVTVCFIAATAGVG